MNRTLEVVTAVILKAKLDESDLAVESQIISYSEDFLSEDSKVFEITNSQLEEFKAGERFVIRGDQDEGAVFCSSTKTFDMTEAETSNLLLVVPGLDLPKTGTESSESRYLKNIEVRKVFQTYYELKATKPRLKKLRHLLEQRRYAGPGKEVETNEKTLSFELLLDQVQASELELRQALEEMNAFYIEGEWRILDVDYCFRLWSLMSGVIDENSWSLGAVSRDVLIETLANTAPVRVLESCLKRFTEPIEDPNTLTVKKDEVARFLGEFLFKRSNQYNLTEFLTTWQQSVPEGIVTTLNQLNGLALAKPESRPPIIRFFPEYELPEDLPERFKALFSVKSKWTLEEITPFLIKITSSPQDVNALLTKHARASLVNGVRHYSAKHAN